MQLASFVPYAYLHKDILSFYDIITGNYNSKKLSGTDRSKRGSTSIVITITIDVEPLLTIMFRCTPGGSGLGCYLGGRWAASKLLSSKSSFLSPPDLSAGAESALADKPSPAAGRSAP